jgi:hypothetical protein
MLALSIAEQIALMQRWMKKRRLTLENLAQMFHRLQRAAIRDASELQRAE